MNSENPNNVNGIGLDPTSLGTIDTPQNQVPLENMQPIPDQVIPNQATVNPAPASVVAPTETLQSEPASSAEAVLDSALNQVAPAEPTLATTQPEVSQQPTIDTVVNPIPAVNQQPASTTPGLDPVAQPIPGTTPQNNPANNINSNGFVEPNKVENIGTTPPNESNGKKPMNKVLFIVLIVVLMAAVAFGVYYYLSLGKNNQDKNIKITTKTVEIEENQPLPTDIEAYATITGTSTKNCNTNAGAVVDNKEAGEYAYTVKCGSVSKTGKVIVKKAAVTVSVELKSVQKAVGELPQISEFVVEDSCNKENCTTEFADAEKLNEYINTPGTYDIPIVVKSGDESSTLTAKLTVVSADFKLFLSCTLESTNKTIDKIAIGQDNTFIGYGKRVYVYTFENEEEYKKAIGQKPATLTYNDVTGSAEYNDSEKTLSISIDLTKDMLDKEYGSAFPSAYSDINTYYRGKNYTCTFER